jgi:GH24 family phage-related lysozyme (muramidase)
MYLDSEGHVTVGIGTKLLNANRAKNIRFLQRESRKAATPEEIGAAYEIIAAGSATQLCTHPSYKLPARRFEFMTNLIIEDETAYTLLESHVKDDYASLTEIYPFFDSFPNDAKLALFDMIYTLGAAGLSRFYRMNNAVLRRDWLTAADQCRRVQAQSDRNLQTAWMFGDAAVDESPSLEAGFDALGRGLRSENRWR